MKKIKYISLFVLLTMFAASCEKDFLTEQPVDNIYSSNLLVDYKGFVNMNNALMSLVRDEYGRVDVNLGGTSFKSLPFAKSTVFSVGADNAWGNNRHTDFRHFSFPKNITAMTDTETFLAIFEWLYKAINTANMIITQAENPDVDWQGGSADGNAKNKATTIAQARLVRAWAYRHLTYTFGDVPLTTEEITGSNYKTDWERNSVAEIREVMVEDLTFAMNTLPLRTTNNTTLSGAIARHYLGELYLAMGNPGQAKTVLQPLVESSEYSLMTSRFGKTASAPGNAFMDVFRSPLYSDGNREVLWAFLNTETESSAYGTSQAFMRNMWQNYYSNLSDISSLSNSAYPGKSITLFWSLNAGKGAGRCAISLGAMALYKYKDQQDKDIRYDESSFVWHLYFLKEDNTVYEVLKNGNSLINLNKNNAMSNDADPTIKQYNLPSTRKWEYIHPIFEQADADGQYNDMVYLRLAETYLLYAEALYKLSDASCISWINKIRDRAGVDPITNSDMSIDLILDERSRELITEEQRRHTLVRLSQENGGDERKASNHFKRRVREHNEVSGRPVRGMHDDDTPVLFPIPKAVIDSNVGKKMEQNPGYL